MNFGVFYLESSNKITPYIGSQNCHIFVDYIQHCIIAEKIFNIHTYLHFQIGDSFDMFYISDIASHPVSSQ